MQRTRIAIVFGGCSEEHDISVKSAMELATCVDSAAHEPVFVGITRSGEWRVCDGPRPGWEQDDHRRALISPDRATHGLLVEDADGYRALRIDVVFPVLHGRTGEDGAVQGLLELSGIPYVGCDVQSSAICMDKSLAHVVARSAGITTPGFGILQGGDVALPEGLAYPVFVKPARSGSSFGVSRVDGPDGLAAACAAARQFDDKVVVEEAIGGTEVGCAVLGYGADVTVGEVDQIRLRHGIFRIHQEDEPEKGSENAVVTVPADLPEEQRRLVQETATRIYRALGCGGLARVDMFLQEDGRILLNEVNTMPGFTSYSRYPRMMAAAGIGGRELFGRCVASAMGR